MAADLVRLVSQSGVLVVSGLLDGRADHVLDALAPLQVSATATREGWVAITLRH